MMLLLRIVVVVAVLNVVAGCGGSDSKTKLAPHPPPPTPIKAAPRPELPDGPQHRAAAIAAAAAFAKARYDGKLDLTAGATQYLQPPSPEQQPSWVVAFPTLKTRKPGAVVNGEAGIPISARVFVVQGTKVAEGEPMRIP